MNKLYSCNIFPLGERSCQWSYSWGKVRKHSHSKDGAASRAQSRSYLKKLSSFPPPSVRKTTSSEEENKLRSTLQTVTYQEVHRPPDLATAKNNDRCKYDASDRQPPRGSGVDSALSRNGSHVGLEGGQRGVALGAGEVTSPESGDAGRQSSSASGSDREKRRERRRFVKA